MPAEVESMFSNREVPWHGLGVIVADAPLSREALILAGLDWEVRQEPLYAGSILIPDKLANVRQSDNSILGIVSDMYRPVQNHEAFAWTDSLVGTGEVRYETAGSLHRGRRIWLLARMSEHREILGDDIEPYLLFVNGHDGETAVRVIMTPVRVVCQNTLSLALAGANASRTWVAQHIGDMDAKLSEARRTLHLASGYLDHLAKFAEVYANIYMDDTKWEHLVEQIYPIDQAAWGVRKIINMELRRDDLRNRILAPDLAGIRYTGWGAVSAVSDHITHAPPLKVTGTWREKRMEELVDGQVILNQAVKLIAMSTIAA